MEGKSSRSGKESPRLASDRASKVSFPVPQNERKVGPPTKPAYSHTASESLRPISQEDHETELHSQAPGKDSNDKRKTIDDQVAAQNMTEPPPKRAKRTDSPTASERNEPPRKPNDRDTREPDTKPSGRDRRRNYRGDYQRDFGREERRYRSRSRDRNERRRPKSRSGEREREKERARDRDGAREREDNGRRDRSRSRDRYRSRRDPPTNRSERQTGRSRSPPRNGASSRQKSPPHGPRVDRSKDSNLDDHSRHGNKDGGHRPDKRGQPAKGRPDDDKMQVDHQGPTDEGDDEADLMKRLMGFTTFKSTQNTKVPGNNVYGVRKEKKTEYRQYMNRVGGFNRPLSPSR